MRTSDGEVIRRADLGLGRVGSRDGAFALCNFNQLYKMEPETFRVWGNALRRLPAAFLWLTRVTVRKDTSTADTLCLCFVSSESYRKHDIEERVIRQVAGKFQLHLTDADRSPRREKRSVARRNGG